MWSVLLYYVHYNSMVGGSVIVVCKGGRVLLLYMCVWREVGSCVR